MYTDKDFTKMYLSRSKSRDGDEDHDNDVAPNSLADHYKPMKEFISKVKKDPLISENHRRNKSQIEILKKKATVLGGKVKRIKRKIKKNDKVGLNTLIIQTKSKGARLRPL
jgi:uncharacterized ubiquitin-like protein YukD